MNEDVRRIGSLGADDDLDPDLAPPQASEVSSPLESLVSQLEDALTADVSFEPITLRIDKRPALSVRYSTELDDDKISAFRKRAEDKKAPQGFNTLRFCSLIVANQCQALLVNDQEALDEVGQNLTFGHARIRKLYGGLSQRASDVARKAIGSDPHVMVHANAILDAAGFGDQAVEVEGDDTPFVG